MFVAGCAQTKYRFKYEKPASEVVWPQPPDIPRYRFVGDIRGESNFKEIAGSAGVLRKSANWLSDLLFGESPPQLLVRPQSGAVDAENQRLYITDVGRKAVYVFDMQSGKVDIWEPRQTSSRNPIPLQGRLRLYRCHCHPVGHNN